MEGTGSGFENTICLKYYMPYYPMPIEVNFHSCPIENSNYQVADMSLKTLTFHSKEKEIKEDELKLKFN